jgi:hypothetical protein
MSTRFNLRYLLVSALLFSLPVCRAQITVPSTASLSFGQTPDTLLWDLSGAYSLNLVVNERNGIQVPLIVGFNLIEDASGNLHGVTNDIQALSLGGAGFTVSYTITGKITGSGGAATAKFTMRIIGNGSVGNGNSDNFSAVLTVVASPNPDDGNLEGVAKFSARVSGGIEGVSGTIPQFSTALPPGVDGTATLNFQIAGFSSVVGTATLTTSSRTLGFLVEGPLRNGVFNCTLKGSSAVQNIDTSGVGSNGKAQIDSTFDTAMVTGKFMGQKFNFETSVSTGSTTD